MNRTNSTNKLVAFAVGGLIALTGIYNTVVINADSNVSFNQPYKRLDEMYGVVTEGRQVAGDMTWKKIAHPKVIERKIRETVAGKSVTATEVSVELSAAVQEELSLSLVEVINPTKYASGLSSSQFSGSLSTKEGVIESLSVSLPNGEGVSVAFTEMNGNVFEYDFNGEIYSGMMYQVDQGAYMVTLSNGPLEGTRLRFSTESPAVEQQMVQEKLAQDNVSVGSFGGESQEIATEISQNDQLAEASEASFNFSATQAL